MKSSGWAEKDGIHYQTTQKRFKDRKLPVPDPHAIRNNLGGGAKGES